MTHPTWPASRAFFDYLRILQYTGISGSWANVGGPFLYPVRGICFTNHTQGDVVFSYDPNAIDIDEAQTFVAAGSFKLWDVQSNIQPQKDDKYVLPVGTQWQVMQLTAPMSGAVYIEVIY